MNTQNRYRSPVLWTAAVAFIMIIMGNYGLYDKIGMTSEVFQRTADALFALLVALGIYNNPTDKENF